MQHIKFYLENPKGRDHLGDLDVDGIPGVGALINTVMNFRVA
jgi:hypothetical protein